MPQQRGNRRRGHQQPFGDARDGQGIAKGGQPLLGRTSNFKSADQNVFCMIGVTAEGGEAPAGCDHLRSSDQCMRKSWEAERALQLSMMRLQSLSLTRSASSSIQYMGRGWMAERACRSLWRCVSKEFTR